MAVTDRFPAPHPAPQNAALWGKTDSLLGRCELPSSCREGPAGAAASATARSPPRSHLRGRRRTGPRRRAAGADARGEPRREEATARHRAERRRRAPGGAQRWPRSHIPRLRHHRRDVRATPAPLPGQSFISSISALLLPPTCLPRGSASPPTSATAGGAGPTHRGAGGGRRAGAAGEDPAPRPGGPTGRTRGGGRAGQRGGERRQGAERRPPRLPLSSVSGWTAVSVAMSAAGLEPEWRAAPAPAWSTGKGGEEAGKERGRRRRVAPWEEEEASGAERVPRGGRLATDGAPRCCGRRAARRGPARAAGIAAPPESPHRARLRADSRGRAGPCAGMGGEPPAVPSPRRCRRGPRREREGWGLRAPPRRAAGRGPDPAARPRLGRGRWGGLCRPVAGRGVCLAATESGASGCGAAPRTGPQGVKNSVRSRETEVRGLKVEPRPKGRVTSRPPWANQAVGLTLGQASPSVQPSAQETCPSSRNPMSSHRSNPTVSTVWCWVLTFAEREVGHRCVVAASCRSAAACVSLEAFAEDHLWRWNFTLELCEVYQQPSGCSYHSHEVKGPCSPAVWEKRVRVSQSFCCLV